MSMTDDIDESIKRAVKKAQTVDTWPGVIVTTNPPTVQIDGSNVPLPCIAADFVSLYAGRRCVVQKVGSDLWVVATAGGPTIDTITLPSYSVGVSTNGSGTITTPGSIALTTPASLVFVAPPSGKLIITWTGRFANTGGNPGGHLLIAESRTGSIVGSGTVVTGPAIRVYYTSTVVEDWQVGMFEFVPPGTFTPGATYNIQLKQNIVGAGTFNITNAKVAVMGIL